MPLDESQSVLDLDYRFEYFLFIFLLLIPAFFTNYLSGKSFSFGLSFFFAMPAAFYYSSIITVELQTNKNKERILKVIEKIN